MDTHSQTPLPIDAQRTPDAQQFIALNPIGVSVLKPGEILVIHSEEPLAPLQKQNLTRQLKAVLRGHGNTFIFLDGPFQIGTKQNVQ